MKADYLAGLEKELRELKGSGYTKLSSHDVELARKFYVDLISGKSNRPRADFRISMTLLICGVALMLGGIIFRFFELSAFGVGIVLIGMYFVLQLYRSKVQNENLTNQARLDALKRVYEEGLISSHEHDEAVTFIVSQEHGNRRN